MIVGGAALGAAWGAIPGLLRAFLHTNEIITSLMLNYVAALVLNYLIFDSLSYWRDTSATGPRLPAGQGAAGRRDLAGARRSARSPSRSASSSPSSSRSSLWVLYTRTRFGFEAQVIGDSPRAARYAGMRTRRKIVAIMCLSGAIAGIGGASQIGDFRHVLDANGLQQASYGYTGIVVAALARYNPFAVVLVAFLLGGLQNAGYTLQGADFPSGLVGVMQGLILFAMLGGELLVRYRITLRRRSPARRRRGGGVNNEHRRRRPRLGGRLRHAAALRGARRAAGRALGRAQPRRRGDDARRRRDGVPRRAAGRRSQSVSLLPLAVAVAALAGAAAALILAFLVITLRANQIVSGLALTIFAGAAGLSSYLGNDFDLADDPARFSFEPGERVRPRGRAGRRARSSSARTSLVYCVVGLRRRRRALPLAHAAGARTCARSASRPRPRTRWGSA